MSVIVFSQPGCPACGQVKSYLTAQGVPFEERNVQADEQAWQELHDRGYSATPLTLVNGEEILGFNRAKLDRVLAAVAS
ncbi:MAG: glutaredoxin family protein [Armatimonadetes bacterium]|nr:glutaredoxin family protein [Armatimonadota bacterium]